MKKLTALILALIMIIASLTSCSSTYPEIESTEEESRVVLSFELDGEKYDVKYELYRAFFLTYKSEIDGGDASVWESDKKDEYVEKINKIIIEKCASVYAVIHLAEKCGLSPYSAATDAKIRDYVKYSVDGYSDENVTTEGFGGDYDAYLASLKELYMNYSVQALMFRYAIAYDALMLYYYGDVDEENPTADMVEGAIKVSDEELLEYYNSSDCVRVLLATINAEYFSRERAEELRNNISLKDSPSAVTSYIIGSTGTTEYDAIYGMLIGKNMLDQTLSSELADTAHALTHRETSRVIDYESDGTGYYYILYRTDKTEDYFKECKSDVRYSYVSNVVGEILSSTIDSLAASAEAEALLESLDHKSISMD